MGPWMPDSPTTPGGSPVAAAAPAWQSWWAYNRDPYLDLRTRLAGLEASSGDASLGLAPTEQQLRDEAIPALVKVLSEGGDTAMLQSALVALARIEDELDGDAHPTAILRHAQFQLRSGSPELAETALVSLGLRGQDTAADTLEALVRNDEVGQAIRGGPVSSRTRVFAAYGLGLLAQRTSSDELRARIGEALAEVLIEDDTATHELHVAAMLAMSLAPTRECAPGEHEDGHVCLGNQIGMMLRYYGDDERDAELRAHAGPVVARLAAVADNPEYKETVGGILLAALEPRADVEPEVVRGAVIGLGHLGDDDGDDIDRDIRSSLEAIAKRGEPLAQRLALVSLARTGARPGEGKAGRGADDARSFLSGQLARGDDGLDGWAGIALGVFEFHRQHVAAGIDDRSMAKLVTSVAREKDPAVASAAVLGLGILRQEDAVDAVLERFERTEDAGLRGYAALSLGLLGAREHADAVRVALDEAEEAAEIYGAALGLRLLGDREVAPLVLERLREVGEDDEIPEDESLLDEQAREEANAAEREVLAMALGLLADRRTVGPLSEIAADSEADPGLRAAAVAALGEMFDSASDSWAAPLTNDLNYGSLPWTLVDPFGDGTGLLELR